jgi:gliding motility-associated-like protein
MKKNVLRMLRYSLLVASIVLFSAVKSFATHVFGIDMYYTWQSGQTYKIYVIVYGDCAGNAFPNLTGATAEVKVYNDPATATVATLTLQEEPPLAGVEVTPVCPADINNTTCTNVNNTIPGIKKFIYSGTYTVPSLSTGWRFHFTGNMGVTQAGRSTTITNVQNPGTTIITLDAKLNNTAAVGQQNSSSVFGTIPTPFYCLNIPANYAPGSVDPNLDSLYFVQIAGRDGAIAADPPVTYIPPYTATAPLAAAPFTFTPTTGQMSFTPNQVQRSLACMEVQEYRAGVLVGTSQREMTIVVLNTCSNYPPTGVISNPSAGTLVDSTTLRVCKDVGAFTFNINPTDANGDTIDYSASGLPAGSTFTVTNNHTTAPTGIFAWNTTAVAPGTYTFTLNYQDNECPLSANQQITYTIIVAPLPGNTFTLVSPATCTKKAVFTVASGVSPWTETVLQGVTVIHTNTNLTNTLTDSLVAGTYTIRTTNDVGCTKDTVITLVSPPGPSFLSLTYTLPTCPGGSDGTVTFTGTGGLSPYQYAYNAIPYGNPNTFTGLAAGTYTLHIRDANLCIKDSTWTLADGPPIYVNANIKRPLCNGLANGQVTLAAYNNNAPPYTYAMNAGPFTGSGTFTNLAAGTYTFHVHNSTGCAKDTVLTLTDSIAVHATLVITNVLCNGGNDGTITATGNNAVSPYTYALNAGPFSGVNTFNGLTAATYTIHVHDAMGCYLDTSAAVTQPTPVAVSATVTNILCNGAATGAIVITASGGTPGYTYANGAGPYTASNTFNGLVAGTYTIHTKDANACIKDTVITLTQPTPLKITSVTMVQPTCNGSANGTMTMAASGGTPGYTYAINAAPFSPTSTFVGLVAATYTLHLKDANGCIKDTIVTLTQPTPVTATAAVKNSTCATLGDGRVVLTAGGGTPTYTYAQGAGPYGPSNTFQPLPAGTYTFHIKDSHGCIKDTTIAIIDSLNPVGIFNITNELCYGQSIGVINVNGSGAQSPYTYALGANPYSPTNNFPGLPAGTYTVHIKDANGCIKDTTVPVTQPTVLGTSISIVRPTCFGFSNGSITALGTGGTPAYTYALNNGTLSATNIFTGLPTSVDTIHIKDNNGCTYDTIVTVTQPPKLEIVDLLLQEPKCAGDQNGVIQVFATGGTPAYSYSVDGFPFQSSSSLGNLFAGPHTIHLRDFNACNIDTNVTLEQPSPLTFAGANITNPTCEGFADGSVTLMGNGGTPPYMYSQSQSNYTSGATFSQLPEGTYNFYLIDSNSCKHDTSITLVGYPHIVLSEPTITPTTCFGSTDGIIYVNATGGVPPFTYQVDGIPNPPTANPEFTGEAAGYHIVTVYDSKNCKKSERVPVPQPDSIQTKMSTNGNLCEGIDDNGAVIADVKGGTPPYSYVWSTDTTRPSGLNRITGLPNGFYRVVIHDAHNCLSSGEAEVEYDNCCTPYLPNAFTPNGDGKNDRFRPVYKGDMTLLKLSIFNRFGQLVYTTTSITDAWDGTYNGVPQDMGTYFFYMEFICGNKGDASNKQMIKGDITLIR